MNRKADQGKADRGRAIRAFFLVCGLLAGPLLGFSQSLPSPEDPLWRYQAWMETAGLANPAALNVYQSSARTRQTGGPWAWLFPRPSPLASVGPADAPWLSLEKLTADIFTSWNSHRPFAANDGALWQGRGSNGKTGFSLDVAGPFFRGALSGELWMAENSGFALMPSGKPSQPFGDVSNGTIDLPQRFGTEARKGFGFGQADLSLVWENLSLGFGTRNYSIGPVLWNPLLLSAHADGFPALHLNLARTDTGWGAFEGMILYGQLSESDFFDADEGNDDTLFSGLFLGYSPPFFPELTLGIHRTVHSEMTRISATDLLIPFWPSISGGSGADFFGSDRRDQRFSLTWRLLFPAVGFETYGEWARNDFSPNIFLIIFNPNHTHAYTLGLKKTFSLSNGWLLGLQAEMTDLVLPMESLINLNKYSLESNFYNHTVITKGYTNRGQVLGAGIGGGSFSQRVDAEILHRNGSFGLWLRRLVPNQTLIYVPDAAYGFSTKTADEYRMDTELSLGLTCVVLIGEWVLKGEFVGQMEWNRYYVLVNNEPNFHFALSLGRAFRAGP